MNSTGYILAFHFFIILGSSAYYVSSVTNREIENLKEYFNANSSHVADGGPLFITILENWKGESDKKIIHSQIVSFYFKFFENVQDNQLIQRSLDTIKEDLFVKVFNSSTSKLNDFQKLTQIPVNDLQVQRKAVNELFSVLSYLSPKPAQGKRKRSQIFLGRRASK